MAGRGRGRGRGKGLSFNVESLGFGRGESLPGALLEPPPAFPPVEVKAVPLATGDRYDYLLALKQEYRANMKESLYYIKPDEKRRDIDRYSDKYQEGQQANKQGCFVWSSIPKELEPRRTKRKAVKSKSNKGKVKKSAVDHDVVKTLEELEKKEGSEVGEEEEVEDEEDEQDAAKKKKSEGEEGEGELEEEAEEEEFEDETDYGMTYFDNGENYGVDEDDDLDDDGAIY